MKSIVGVTILAAATMLVGCGNGRLMPQDNHRLRDDRGRASLGYLEHRGQFHNIHDLMDPGYRAQSDNEFVSEFDSDAQLATLWAGR